MNTPRAIFLGISVAGVLIAGALLISDADTAMVFGTLLVAILTGALAFLTYLNVRIMKSIEWFSGAMERHSDQMRQIAAQNAEIKLIWWDKTQAPDGRFPFEGRHNEEFKLERIFIGMPIEEREKQPGRLHKWIWGR